MDKNEWDKIFNNNPKYKPLNEIFLDRLLKKIKKDINPSAKKMVDLGCGDSNTIFQFSKRGFDVLGIDFSPVALNKLQEKINKIGRSDIKLINADLNHLETKLNADIFLCQFVYAFIENQDNFLKKISEFMNSDSVFILITPVTHSNISYTPEDKPQIAVDFETTLKKLKDIFKNVDVYHHDYIGLKEDYVTFLIKK
jgi:ubiquinone/menaquinone biosynthesis C-methylase UbiE